MENNHVTLRIIYTNIIYKVSCKFLLNAFVYIERTKLSQKVRVKKSIIKNYRILVFNNFLLEYFTKNCKRQKSFIFSS